MILTCDFLAPMGAYMGQYGGFSEGKTCACSELCGYCKWWASKYRVRIELVCGMTSGAQGECWVASDTELVVNKDYVSGYNSFFPHVERSCSSFWSRRHCTKHQSYSAKCRTLTCTWSVPSSMEGYGRVGR